MMDWLEYMFFKYYSKETLGIKGDWVRYLTAGLMMIPFTLGLIGTIAGWADLVRISTWILICMLVPFALVWIVVFFYHNHKIKKLGGKWS